MTFSHLICTLISENEGLDNFRSVSNLRKISGPAHLNFFQFTWVFFSVCHLDFFLAYGINLAFSKWRTRKNPGLKKLKFFYGLKRTLIFRRCRLKGRLCMYLKIGQTRQIVLRNIQIYYFNNSKLFVSSLLFKCFNYLCIDVTKCKNS